MRLVAIITVAIGLVGLACAAVADTPTPLALRNSAVGGGALNSSTPGVEGGVGVNNIGLLIRSWGKVTFVDSTNKFFYINDGTASDDKSGHIGIRVSYDNLATGVSITPPALNSYVAVTGISSTVMISNKVQPNIRPRRQTDITQVAM